MSYDDWKTTDPREDEPQSDDCPTCEGTGAEIVEHDFGITESLTCGRCGGTGKAVKPS